MHDAHSIKDLVSTRAFQEIAFGAGLDGRDDPVICIKDGKYDNPEWKVYAFDPGDMRTQMHQEAFPGEDISDRPMPEEVALPGILNLIESDLPSGRYTASSIAATASIG